MGQPNPTSPFDRFRELVKRLVAVPKKEIIKAEAKRKNKTKKT